MVGTGEVIPISRLEVPVYTRRRRGKNQDQERYENKTLQDIYNDDSE